MFGEVDWAAQLHSPAGVYGANRILGQGHFRGGATYYCGRGNTFSGYGFSAEVLSRQRLRNLLTCQLKVLFVMI